LHLSNQFVHSVLAYQFSCLVSPGNGGVGTESIPVQCGYGFVPPIAFRIAQFSF